MDKHVFRGLGLAALFLLFFLSDHAACYGQALAAKTVRVGFPSRSALSWPLFVAEEKKIYATEGLAVELLLIQGGAARAVQILTAGDLDFVVVGTITTLTAHLKGSPVVIVSGLVNLSPFEIYVNPEIDSVRGLRGKAIVSGALGGPPHFVVSVVLRAAGLDPKRDIKQFAMAGGHNRIVALEQRQVDAAVLEPPFSFRAAEMGFRRIASARDYLPDDQNNAVATSRPLLQRDPEKVRKFLRAVTKGMRFIESNREESIKVLEKYTKQSRPVLEKTYDFIVPTISEKVNMKGVKAIHQYLVDFGIATASDDQQGFVDLRFLPQDG